MSKINDNKIGNKIFGRFSVKTKLIIFLILAIVAGGSVLLNNTSKKNKINKDNQNVKTSIKSKEKKEIKKIDETKNKKQEELEKKSEEGRKAFFNKEYEKAISIENEVIKEDENFYKAYNIKGIILCYSGNFKEGMKNIDKALKINPDFGYGRFNKALAYELYEHFDEALKWYDKALEIEKYEWSYYGKASIYGRRGDAKNTVKYLKLAIEKSKGVKEEAKTEKDFDPVRNSKEFKELIK